MALLLPLPTQAAVAIIQPGISRRLSADLALAKGCIFLKLLILFTRVGYARVDPILVFGQAARHKAK
jgi:hypothetical protein